MTDSTHKPFNTPQSSMPDRVIIILGMHRSGTSCLTGSLQQGGLELGEHSTWNLHNTKGNRENNYIMQLHEDILASNNCSWHYPKKKIAWLPEQLEQASSILKANAQQATWGFKDPRTLFTLNGWLSLGINAQYVGVFRDPTAVAASLLKRGSGTGAIQEMSHALELWYQYNSQMLTAYKKQAFPILSFDWDEDTFHQALKKLHDHLQLKPLADDERFYEQTLVHNQSEAQRLPWKVRRLYKKLKSISELYQ